MSKKLDISTILKDFEGIPIPVSDKDATPTTLKRVLLTYCRMAGQIAGLSEADQQTIYEVGMLVGTGNGTVSLSQAQFDALKKMCDSGKVKVPGEGEMPLLGSEVRWQVKALVDRAEEESPVSGINLPEN